MSAPDKVVSMPQKTLSKALLAARASFGKVTKDNTAKIPTKAGGSYSYKYADLGSVLEAVEPALTEHGILISHTTTVHDGVPYLVTELTHVESEKVKMSEYPIPIGGTAQEQGSWLTYLRRYHLVCMLSLVTEDDDGGAASKPKNGQPKAADHAPVNQEPTLSAEQVAAVWVVARQHIDKDELKDVMFNILSSFGVNETAKVPAAKYQALIDAIWGRKK